jgi:hypothetical protein
MRLNQFPSMCNLYNTGKNKFGPRSKEISGRDLEETMEYTYSSRAAQLGALVFIAWNLFFGPVGLALLIGMAYAIVVKNLALGIICGMSLLVPLLFTVLFLPLNLSVVRSEQRVPVVTAVRFRL